ncbi:MAG: glycosyltransferase family 4 protein [Candidatus Altiarchaeota archaeon]
MQKKKGRKLKILFISRRFYPDITGGGQISAYYITKALRDLGQEVFVLTFTTKEYKEEEMDGIKIFRIPLIYIDLPFISHICNLEFMYLQIAYHTNKFIKQIRPDVVHLLNMESIIITSLILKIRGIPCFATVNSPWICYTGNCVDYKGNSCTKCSSKKMLRCVIKKEKGIGLIKYLVGFIKFIYGVLHMKERKFFTKKVDKLFPVSEAIKKLFIENGFNENKLKIIHNPIPLQEKVKTNLKEKLGISKNKQIILYAGRVTQEKGVHIVIKAMKYIDDSVFLVVGRGSYSKLKTPYYRSLEKIVEEYKLEDKVKFVGFVKPEYMKEYYSITNLVVLPCTFYEPLSRMLLEACSYGIPIIASNVGGNPEIVEDGKNGILLKNLEIDELARAIRYILENSNVYKEMSKNCKEKIKNEFSPEKIGREILEEYRRIMPK